MSVHTARRPISETSVALYVAFTVLISSLLDISARLPQVPDITKYFALYFGIAAILLFMLPYLNRIKFRGLELAIIAILTVLVPFSLLQNQNMGDVVGNYLRYLFPILAIWFWSIGSLNSDRLIKALYSSLWVVAIILVGFYYGLKVTGLIRPSPQHFTVLIFLFAVAIKNNYYKHLIILIGMALISGKEAIYLAILLMFIMNIFFNGRFLLVIPLLIALIAQVFLGGNIFLWGLEQLNNMGGNASRLSDLLMNSNLTNFDERTLNSITSNRYQEYKSIWLDWSENGIPFLGRGLGSTVLVYMGFSGEFIERSTLHNSFIVVFQTLGIAGLIYIWIYFISSIFRLVKISKTLLLAQIGILCYALFSNTLLTSPTMVLISAVSWQLVHNYRISRKRYTIPRLQKI